MIESELGAATEGSGPLRGVHHLKRMLPPDLSLECYACTGAIPGPFTSGARHRLGWDRDHGTARRGRRISIDLAEILDPSAATVLDGGALSLP